MYEIACRGRPPLWPNKGGQYGANQEGKSNKEHGLRQQGAGYEANGCEDSRGGPGPAAESQGPADDSERAPGQEQATEAQEVAFGGAEVRAE
jgi:hypothetical protein